MKPFFLVLLYFISFAICLPQEKKAHSTNKSIYKISYPRVNSLSFGLLFNTKTSIDKGGFGFNFAYMNMQNTKSVIGLTFKTSFSVLINDAKSENFVNTGIPHNDYTDLGVQPNFNFDFYTGLLLNPINEFGIYSCLGINFLSGLKIFKSNVTGLKWNGGNTLEALPSFEVGLRINISPGIVFNPEINFNKYSSNILTKLGFMF